MGNMADSQDKSTPKVSGNQVGTPYLTSWCGGMGCDNCKLCLIFSGKAELVKTNGSKLTFKVGT